MSADALPPAGLLPDAAGHFGRFGGRFVPGGAGRGAGRAGRRVPARRWPTRRSRPSSTALLRDYAGTPSPALRRRRGSPRRLGARILLKREDLNHTGAHKVRNVLGQALLTKRMGKPRVIAETGAGQHGVATATAAALFDLECVVYMGEEDTRRQALNVARMRMLGATVVPVTTGSRTLKDAMNEAMRDWVTNVDDTHYLIGTVAGPHPFPAMVRDFVRGIGVEARAAVPGPDRRAARRGRAPASAAAPTRSASSTPSSRTTGVAAVRLRGRRRRASTPAGTRPASPAAPSACCTAPAPTCCRTPTARPSSRTRSRPAWTTRASGPEHAWLHDTGRATLRAGRPTPRRWPRSSCSAGPRGSSRRSRARTRSPAPLRIAPTLAAELGREPTIVVNLSGRGDKDVHTAGEYFGILDKERDA